jgi:hypothetical protein
MVLADRIDRGGEIDQQVVDFGDSTAGAVAFAVAAVVVTDDPPATSVEEGGDVRIAADVLAEAVDEHNRSSRRLDRPFASAQGQSVAGPHLLLVVHPPPPPP